MFDPNAPLQIAVNIEIEMNNVDSFIKEMPVDAAQAGHFIQQHFPACVQSYANLMQVVNRFSQHALPIFNRLLAEDATNFEKLMGDNHEEFMALVNAFHHAGLQKFQVPLVQKVSEHLYARRQSGRSGIFPKLIPDVQILATTIVAMPEAMEVLVAGAFVHNHIKTHTETMAALDVLSNEACAMVVTNIVARHGEHYDNSGLRAFFAINHAELLALLQHDKIRGNLTVQQQIIAKACKRECTPGRNYMANKEQLAALVRACPDFSKQWVDCYYGAHKPAFNLLPKLAKALAGQPAAQAALVDCLQRANAMTTVRIDHLLALIEEMPNQAYTLVTALIAAAGDDAPFDVNILRAVEHFSRENKNDFIAAMLAEPGYYLSTTAAVAAAIVCFPTRASELIQAASANNNAISVAAVFAEAETINRLTDENVRLLADHMLAYPQTFFNGAARAADRVAVSPIDAEELANNSQLFIHCVTHIGNGRVVAAMVGAMIHSDDARQRLMPTGVDVLSVYAALLEEATIAKNVDDIADAINRLAGEPQTKAFAELLMMDVCRCNDLHRTCLEPGIDVFLQKLSQDNKTIFMQKFLDRMEGSSVMGSNRRMAKLLHEFPEMPIDDCAKLLCSMLTALEEGQDKVMAFHLLIDHLRDRECEDDIERLINILVDNEGDTELLHAILAEEEGLLRLQGKLDEAQLAVLLDKIVNDDRLNEALGPHLSDTLVSTRPYRADLGKLMALVKAYPRLTTRLYDAYNDFSLRLNKQPNRSYKAWLAIVFAVTLIPVALYFAAAAIASAVAFTTWMAVISPVIHMAFLPTALSIFGLATLYAGYKKVSWVHKNVAKGWQWIKEKSRVKKKRGFVRLEDDHLRYHENFLDAEDVPVSLASLFAAKINRRSRLRYTDIDALLLAFPDSPSNANADFLRAACSADKAAFKQRFADKTQGVWHIHELMYKHPKLANTMCSLLQEYTFGQLSQYLQWLAVAQGKRVKPLPPAAQQSLLAWTQLYLAKLPDAETLLALAVVCPQGHVSLSDGDHEGLCIQLTNLAAANFKKLVPDSDALRRLFAVIKDKSLQKELYTKYAEHHAISVNSEITWTGLGALDIVINDDDELRRFAHNHQAILDLLRQCDVRELQRQIVDLQADGRDKEVDALQQEVDALTEAEKQLFLKLSQVKGTDGETTLLDELIANTADLMAVFALLQQAQQQALIEYIIGNIRSLVSNAEKIQRLAAIIVEFERKYPAADGTTPYSDALGEHVVQSPAFKRIYKQKKDLVAILPLLPRHAIALQEKYQQKTVKPSRIRVHRNEEDHTGLELVRLDDYQDDDDIVVESAVLAQLCENPVMFKQVVVDPQAFVRVAKLARRPEELFALFDALFADEAIAKAVLPDAQAFHGIVLDLLRAVEEGKVSGSSFKMDQDDNLLSSGGLDADMIAANMLSRVLGQHGGQAAHIFKGTSLLQDLLQKEALLAPVADIVGTMTAAVFKQIVDVYPGGPVALALAYPKAKETITAKTSSGQSFAQARQDLAKFDALSLCKDDDDELRRHMQQGRAQIEQALRIFSRERVFRIMLSGKFNNKNFTESVDKNFLNRLNIDACIDCLARQTDRGQCEGIIEDMAKIKEETWRDYFDNQAHNAEQVYRSLSHRLVALRDLGYDRQQLTVIQRNVDNGHAELSPWVKAKASKTPGCSVRRAIASSLLACVRCIEPSRHEAGDDEVEIKGQLLKK